MSNPSITAASGTLFVRETGRRYREATSEEVLAVARDTVERHFKRDVEVSDPASVRRGTGGEPAWRCARSSR